MAFDIDYLISFYKNLNALSSELGEQGEAGGSAAGGGAKPLYPTVTKWETGLTRGPANQIGLTKWKDIVQIKRGKANTLL